MFQPYYNPYMQPMQKQEVTRVNGENGARALNLAPNSSALALDETGPIVWFCQTDGAGYKTVTPYSITPIQPEAPANLRALENRITKLEEMLNAKSNTISTEQNT